MAQRNGDEREDHDLPAVPVQTECDGEQPAHGGIDPVEHAEPGERQPSPHLCHGERVRRRGFRITRAALRDSNRSPTSSPRLPGAPDADDGSAGTPWRTPGRTRYARTA